MRRLSDRIWIETGHLGSNNGVIDGGESGLVLVDSPHKPSDAIRWNEAATAIGEPRYLVFTDHHPDHTIGAHWLPGTIVAHRDTRQRLLDEPPSDAYLRELLGVLDPPAVAWLDDYTVRLPAITFTERLTLHLEGLEVALIHRPGHTRNTIMVHVPSERVLFTGDDFCEQGLPSFQDCRLGDFFDALDAIDALDVDVLVPGHGEPAPPAAIERYRELAREVVGEVAAAIAAGAPSEEAQETVRFEDLIHVGWDDVAGYPEDLIEGFQRRSIERIYEELVRDESLAHR